MNNQTALTVQKLDGFEIVQHEGKPYVPGYRSAARIVSIGLEKPISAEQVKRTINQLLRTVTDIHLINTEAITAQGERIVTLIPHQFIGKLIRKYNDPLADRLDEAGTVVFLNKLVGNEVQITPPSFLEALKLAVIQQEKIEMLEKCALLDASTIAGLNEEVEHQAEIIDELFSYSSIVRIAKFNCCDEKSFSWRALKSASNVLGLEIKSAPCPRFGTKNLYDHRAWEYVYPHHKLPESSSAIAKPE